MALTAYLSSFENHKSFAFRPIKSMLQKLNRTLIMKSCSHSDRISEAFRAEFPLFIYFFLFPHNNQVVSTKNDILLVIVHETE
jgi:hypothetical protein